MRSEEMIKLLPSGLRDVLQKMNLDVAGLQEIICGQNSRQ